MNKFIKGVRVIPKIIENAREVLICEAGRQLFSDGYQKLNIRAVASNCHIGIGTVYHYFPSKEVLVASVILKDWLEALSEMDQLIASVPSLSDGVRELYRIYGKFLERYSDIFSKDGPNIALGTFSERHIQLRSQIESRLHPLVTRFQKSVDSMDLRAIAQLFLTAGTEKWEFTDLFCILKKLV